MPIYEYQCNACGHRLEKLQKISDSPLTDCPACSRPELSKLVSAAAFRLKGGGWYETDFKTGAKKNLLGGSEAGSDSAGASKSDSSADGSKSEGSGTKADTKSEKSGDSGGSKPDVAAAAS